MNSFENEGRRTREERKWWDPEPTLPPNGRRADQVKRASEEKQTAAYLVGVIAIGRRRDVCARVC